MHQDPLHTCPYDSIHQIFRSRMPYHLLRCSQNFPCSKKKQCPFDARHLVNPIEFNYHINNCPSRENVWHYKIKSEEEQNILPIEIEPIALNQCNENWDDEPEVRSYNPEKIIQNRPIVRSSVGLSKAKRRQFRMDERRRIQEIDAMNERKQKIVAQVEAPVDEYKPLRRPKKFLTDANSSIVSLNSSMASAAGDLSAQQKKVTSAKTENQTKANTSKESNVTQKVQGTTAGEAPKSNATNTEYKQLRRPKTLPNGKSTISEQPSNLSNPALQIKSAPAIGNASISSNSTQKPNIPKPKPVPFSYAAALSKNISKIDEQKENDDEKENITNNSFSVSLNDTVIEKLSKTIEELAMDDEGHKKKTEQLDKELSEKWKTFKEIKSTNSDKKVLKCAANFQTSK